MVSLPHSNSFLCLGASQTAQILTGFPAAKHVLGYNEPDLGSQASMIPSVAVAGW